MDQNDNIKIELTSFEKYLKENHSDNTKLNVGNFSCGFFAISIPAPEGLEANGNRSKIEELRREVNNFHNISFAEMYPFIKEYIYLPALNSAIVPSRYCGMPTFPRASRELLRISFEYLREQNNW